MSDRADIAAFVAESREPRADASSSPTASSTCCIPVTCAICRRARAEGDALIVGRELGSIGPRQQGPVAADHPERERAEILAALACVDAVVIFDEDTPAEIIRPLQPDVLVKGADWAADRIVGRDTVEARGGRVVRIPVEQGWSTSAIIEKIQTPVLRHECSSQPPRSPFDRC